VTRTDMIEIGLSLGSNVGHRLANLQNARAAIRRIPGVDVVAASPVYETEPVDVSPAHRHLPFLNAVLILRSGIDPQRLAEQLHAIETELGRERTADRNAPRPIDIDMLYADGLELRTAALQVPHPRWAERRFVVEPLAAVRPELRLPGESCTVAAVLSSLPQTPNVVVFLLTW
jgi:2-amino-4-hydroxy-6-hydroxymethyldihydropteridine diphosphokinase